MLIGVVGFIGSGKGTVGEFLVKNHNFTTDSFAKSLKDAASAIFDWDREMLEGNTPESRFWREQPDKFWSERLGIKKFTPRLALQWLGTEAGRKVFGENLWTASVEKRWINAGKPNTVITDCRFPNEIKMIRDLGGKVIRVKKGPEPSWYQLILFYNRGQADEEDKKEIQQMQASGILPHESEWAWIGCDVDELIKNEGTLSDLENNVLAIVEKFANVEVQHSLSLG